MMKEIDISNKKLFIFDWDGTLSNSIGMITACVIETFQELNFPEISVEKAKSIIGLGVVQAIIVLTPGFSEQDRDLLAKTYKKNFQEKSSKGILLYPGVESALTFLQNQGLKMAVATGKSRPGLERELSNSNLKPYFQATRTTDDCNAKPDPHMILDIMKELDCIPKETIMIGDTTFDLEMAENAGVESIAITGGAHSIELLEKCKPLKSFSSFQDFSYFLTNEYSL
jgi:phosphoglycolate phosphatase